MSEIYKEEEVLKETLKYFNGDDLPSSVWIDKYALRDSKGNLLEKSPIDMFNRLADEFYRIECKFKGPIPRNIIYGLLRDFNNIIPAGSILFGVGNNYSKASLANCFLIESPADSYGGIMKADQELVQIMKRRGGCGLDISSLRPKDSTVSNAAKSSTGAISFMERFSNTTREVAQGGRRGALALTMNSTHKDINEFITAKDDNSKVTGANISVKVTDEFMNSLENNEDNKKTWKLLVQQAHKNAEPGILFWDTVKRESPADCYSSEGFDTQGINPCAELALSPYDSCRLMSINLTNFVKHPFTKEAVFDEAKLYAIACAAQRLMDDVIELEKEKIDQIINKIMSDPEPQEIKDVEYKLWTKIRHTLLTGRRTGLSGIGLGDMLAQLGIPYGSEEAITMASKVYKSIAKASYRTSIELAKTRGSFPIWSLDKERKNPFIRRILSLLPPTDIQDYMKFGRRNIGNLTLPPSGSLSILAKISSGIEPVFAITYKRRRKVDKGNIIFVDKSGDKWEEYSVFHPKFIEWYQIISPNISSPYEAKKALEQAPSDVLDSIIKLSPYYRSTAEEIDPLYKIELQGEVQKYIDHAISSTINLKQNATKEQVEELYKKAWAAGCKGLTVYRAGSRDGVLITNNNINNNNFEQRDAPKRPKVLPAEAFTTTVAGEKFTVILGLMNNKPYEVFAYKGNDIQGKGEIIKKKRGDYIFIAPNIEENITDDLTDEQETITRVISYGLRHGGDVMFAVEQLNKTKGDLLSFNKAISRILKRYISNGKSVREKCPQCNAELKYEDGCEKCSACQWSKCN